MEINSIAYPKEFFHAQITFGLAWSKISCDDLNHVFLTRTGLHYRLCNILYYPKRDMHPLWLKFMHAITLNNGTYLNSADDITDIYFKLYTDQPYSVYTPRTFPANDGIHFGCFSYAYHPYFKYHENKNCIYIHFNNTERGEKSALAADFAENRFHYLKEMFSEISTRYPEAEMVTGGSWLYNLDAFRNNFPSAYLETAKRLVPVCFEQEFPGTRVPLSFKGNSLWGQFINRAGFIREPGYTEFLHSITQAQSLKELLNAFPLKPLEPFVNIEEFYEYFDIGHFEAN